MDFEFSDEQEQLRQTARELLERYNAPAAARRIVGNPGLAKPAQEPGELYDRVLWGHP